MSVINAIIYKFKMTTKKKITIAVFGTSQPSPEEVKLA